MVFQPHVVETFGGWHESAIALIKKLGQAMARAGEQDENEVIRHLFGRLSVLLMRDNATLVVSRKPNHPRRNVNGQLQIVSHSKISVLEHSSQFFYMQILVKYNVYSI